MTAVWCALGMTCLSAGLEAAGAAAGVGRSATVPGTMPGARAGIPARGGRAIPAGVKAMTNIAYVENGHRNQVLDLYLPEQPSDKPFPLMIWVHGGAWSGGTQANPPMMYLAQKGFAVASIQHRMSGDAKWPAQSFDCKAAVRFLRANAGKYNIDPERFGIGGDSSGGHLASFVGTSGDVKEMEGDLGVTGVSSRVQAVVDLFGPTDFTLMDEQNGGRGLQHNTRNSPESNLLGGPLLEMKEAAKTANPLTYIDKNDPPFLILHGDNDQLVPLEQSVILAKALIDAGVEVTMQTLRGAGHGTPHFYNAESQRLVLEFLDRKLKPVK
jgi:acetyl esterase/lipase